MLVLVEVIKGMVLVGGNGGVLRGVGVGVIFVVSVVGEEEKHPAPRSVSASSEEKNGLSISRGVKE